MNRQDMDAGRYFYRLNEVSVLDGDTVRGCVDLGFDLHHDITIRMKGINAPEIHTKNAEEKVAGLKAKTVLQDLVCGTLPVWVRTELDKSEKFGRTLGILFAEDSKGNIVNINEALLSGGFAKSYDGGRR